VTDQREKIYGEDESPGGLTVNFPAFAPGGPCRRASPHVSRVEDTLREVAKPDQGMGKNWGLSGEQGDAGEKG